MSAPMSLLNSVNSRNSTCTAAVVPSVLSSSVRTAVKSIPSPCLKKNRNASTVCSRRLNAVSTAHILTGGLICWRALMLASGLNRSGQQWNPPDCLEDLSFEARQEKLHQQAEIHIHTQAYKTYPPYKTPQYHPQG
jgi:hypothetical protein